MATLVPGWNPSPLKGDLAAAALSSISNVGNASSTGTTIVMPTVVAGDFAILMDAAAGFGVPASVTPSNFNLVCTTNNGSTSRGNVFWKLCNGTESGSTLTGMASGGLGVRKSMVILRGDVELTAITTGSAQNGAFNTGNPGAITVAASGGTPPLLVIGTYLSDSGAIDPRTFSTTKDAEQSFHAGLHYIAWKLYLSSPANTNIDMDDEGNGNLIQGFYAQLSI